MEDDQSSSMAVKCLLTAREACAMVISMSYPSYQRPMARSSISTVSVDPSLCSRG